MQDYNVIVFGKYTNTKERDLAVNNIKKSTHSYIGQEVWAKPDQIRSEVRVLESVLFAARKMMVDWQ